MSDTITPASLREHADHMERVHLDGISAEEIRQEAARLEAESARDEEAERLAEVYRVAFKAAAGDSYITDGSWAVAGIRAVLDRLAADGRLLPEGGTVLAGAEREQFEQWLDQVTNCAEQYGNNASREAAVFLRARYLPPAVSVPDSGPDGTPEKPWPTWQDVPEGVKYRSRYSHRWGRMAFINTNGEQHWIDSHDRTWRTFHNDADHVELAPFVRVDGDKA